jgi:hypothetical protein
MFGYDLDTYVDMSLVVTEATSQASALRLVDGAA